MNGIQAPYVTVNAAMTVDGKIDSVERRGARISSPSDLERVDRLRAACDAVLVGGNTLLRDDPALVVRSPLLRAERKACGRSENPAKVAVVTAADIDLSGDFATAGPARRIVFATRKTNAEKVEKLLQAGMEVFVDDSERVNLVGAFDSLRMLGIERILVEGGGTLIASLFELELVDELCVYVAPAVFGGAEAPTLADGNGLAAGQARRLELESAEKSDTAGGVLLRYLVAKGERYGP